MLILGIESSCDDTSVALVDCSENGHFVVSQKTASQIEVHKKYGGVVPEIAGRMHAEKIVPLIEEVLTGSPLEGGPDVHRGGGGVGERLSAAHTPRPPRATDPLEGVSTKPDIIAVTSGPGLVTGLIVGVEAARTLSYAWNIPLVGVNHIEGHVHSVEISNTEYQISNEIPNHKSQITNKSSAIGGSAFGGKIINFPALCLVVSGGHTELILMSARGGSASGGKSHTEYQILGATKDDAAGECFDKAAKLLGLPYPGGPEISKLAETGNTKAIDFPRPMLRDPNFDFSFSGLKTSALYWLRDNKLGATRESPLEGGPDVHRDGGGVGQRLSAAHTPRSPRATDPLEGVSVGTSPITESDFCASFEQAIVDVLVGKTLKAAEKFKPKTIILAGGVAANKKLRQTLQIELANRFPTSEFRLPTAAYCMDNAAMIAVAGYYRAINKDFTNWDKIEPNPNWKIG